MLPTIDGFIALSVILEGPGARPEVRIVCRQHSAFAAGGEDLVLAERKSIYITDGSDRPPL